ncbi:hypothetical protein POM88_025420 [Heracleum sosnowskyi]|uniref:Helitron helicase-like domain-containing protein n=1 Tax=Heracleum sosnowskyi TaxID=360622 RepID=A0AAD8MMD9_9APIA|nr:hypothetical protein POM88_025420 [Heracleum sosnowskyi]
MVHNNQPDMENRNYQISNIREYNTLGPRTAVCQYCNAIMWKEERNNKKVTKGMPKISLCCSNGQVRIPLTEPLPTYLQNLYDDKDKGPKFMKCIRIYNFMLSFTSMGAHIDHSINRGGGPYQYRQHGINIHRFGSLLPNVGEQPKFCQLYVYDTKNEVDNCMRAINLHDTNVIDPDILENLLKMLDETNELVKCFRMARDRFDQEDIVDLRIVMKSSRSTTGRENRMTPSNEVAAIIVGDIDDTCGQRDIVIESKTEDIKKKIFFGRCDAVMYVIEYQKRGLPHVHMLIWLHPADKATLSTNVDTFVSVEIPAENTNPYGHQAVKTFMMHEPCGANFPHSPCMDNYICTKKFPKKYCQGTMFDKGGFPIYKRRKTGVTVKVKNVVLDNQWVVPFNRNLLVRYQCHINIEICNQAMSIKYLFKYCLKGPDRATIMIQSDNGTNYTLPGVPNQDEIKTFLDGKYVYGAEATHPIFCFDVHHRTISVERLPVHLSNEKRVTFRETDNLQWVCRTAEALYLKVFKFSRSFRPSEFRVVELGYRGMTLIAFYTFFSIRPRNCSYF